MVSYAIEAIKGIRNNLDAINHGNAGLPSHIKVNMATTITVRRNAVPHLG